MKIHTSKLGQNFEKIVQDAIKAHQPVADTGAAVAVIKDGQLAFAAGFGLRDRAAKADVDADTCFPIGSATKAFTSMAVSMQAAKGRLTLDEPIRKLLPDFELKDPNATRDATLTDVLSHQTGLAPHNCLWYLGPFNRSGLYYRLRYLEFATPFGTPNTFVYNNLMYMVAGYLLETMSGDSYEDIITNSILAPLGMTSTNLSFDELKASDNHAKGYENDTELALKDFANIAPAAAINSTVLDMAKWTQLFLSKGVGNGHTLLGQKAIERMYKPIVATHDEDATMYGLGWNVWSIAGPDEEKRLIFHTGDPVGGSAYVSFMPDDGLSVVILTNQHCTQQLIGKWPDKAALDIYDHLLNGPNTGGVAYPQRSIGHGLGMAAASAAAAAAAKAAALKPAAAPRAAAAAAPGQLPDGCAGLYSDHGYGEFAVSRTGPNLIMNYYGSSWPLMAISAQDFAFAVPAFGTIFPVKGSFAKNGSGAVTGLGADLVLQPHTLKISFTKR